MEGPLSKWTNVMKGWQYRWFVLDDNAGLLSYYTSREKMMRGSRRGCVRLGSAIIGIDDEDDSTFTITVDQKIFHFQARDTSEREQWVTALEDTIARHSKGRCDAHINPRYVVDIDQKLAESDSYLKMLVKSARTFERKINLNEDPIERANYESVQVTTMELVESIKQAIVLLQIAKAAIVSQPNEKAGKEETPNTARDIGILPKQLEKENLTDTMGIPAEHGIKKMEENNAIESDVDQNKLIGRNVADEINSSPAPDSVELLRDDVPMKSYSSSDEEDDEFYDAGEEVEMKSKSNSVSGSEQENIDLPLSNGVTQEEDKVTGLEDKMEDLFMQEEDHNAKEGESVEEHKSVIMHLLSQVKLGMDLTKVVLPTFILERRSLLEMYADFFAHPDLFVSIAEGTSPAERMIRCLRWYLSSFHAGRKGSVAKKPYNPILGETFQCFYNLPDSPPDEYEVSDGPVPWVHRNQLAFLAEQVSHHPPVSAFYCEHVNKQIQFNAHIWTKSKFLGLSIGVHNLGQGCVRLLDNEEEYIVNFPNGYGRSILTVPWVELGGQCSITCEKTGYNASITFHTKPFYGGKVHRISGEVFAPDEKKPIFTVDGEWNGVMYSKVGKGESECFINTKEMKTITKVVKRIEHQTERESRRLWKDVTHNLKLNKIDEATTSKRFLEDQQRREAKERLENNIKYQTIHFIEDQSGNWIFKKSLVNRV